MKLRSTPTTDALVAYYVKLAGHESGHRGFEANSSFAETAERPDQGTPQGNRPTILAPASANPAIYTAEASSKDSWAKSLTELLLAKLDQDRRTNRFYLPRKYVGVVVGPIPPDEQTAEFRRKIMAAFKNAAQKIEDLRRPENLAQNSLANSSTIYAVFHRQTRAGKKPLAPLGVSESCVNLYLTDIMGV